MKKLILATIISLLSFSTAPLLAMQDPDLIQEDHYGSSQIPPTWAFLKEGDCIEIVAPSGGPLTPEHEGAAKELISQNGFKVFLPEGAINQEASHYKYYANSHEKRAQYFLDALQGDSKAIWALRGGFGGLEVVELFKRSHVLSPTQLKPFIGFSDDTSLHLQLAIWKIPSLHGPVVGLGEELFSLTKVGVNKNVKLSDMFPILLGKVRELQYSFDVIHPGITSLDTPILGSVMGGNLSIIEAHKGTSTALNGKGRFVFLEDTTEDGKRLSRRLVGLKSAGVFDDAKGIIFGNNPIQGLEGSQATKDAIGYFVNDFLLPDNINIPVVYSDRFGHGAYNDVMPLGTVASLNVHGEKATLKVSVNESAYK